MLAGQQIECDGEIGNERVSDDEGESDDDSIEDLSSDEAEGDVEAEVVGPAAAWSRIFSGQAKAKASTAKKDKYKDVPFEHRPSKLWDAATFRKMESEVRAKRDKEVPPKGEKHRLLPWRVS